MYVCIVHTYVNICKDLDDNFFAIFHKNMGDREKQSQRREKAGDRIGDTARDRSFSLYFYIVVIFLFSILFIILITV